MIDVTEKAVGQIRRLMEQQELNSGGLRVGVVGGGCSGLSYSLRFAAARRSAEMAAEIAVDRLLGGTEVAATLDILAGSGISYFPFPGHPVDHPTRLKGRPQDVAEHCRRFLDQGAAGADLLAYRAVDAEPLALVKAARQALGTAPLIVAGSIDSKERINDLAQAGVDAFTIGTAIFENAVVPERPGLTEQLKCVAAWAAASWATGRKSLSSVRIATLGMRSSHVGASELMNVPRARKRQ